MTERRRDWAPLAVFLAAALFFFLGATSRDLWTTGEHRYAEVARVVTAAGGDHLVPHLNGEVYPDKPPLFFWAAGAAHRFLGLDLPISAKLPSILGTAFTVMLTFLLGRRWYGTHGGLVAAGVLATAELTDWAARFAHIDAFLTTVITCVFYCYVRADETPRENAVKRSIWAALGFLAVGAGILVKGPAAPLIPGATILVFLLWTSPRELLTPKLLWGVLLVALPGAVWAWCAAQDAGWGYIDGLVRGQAIAHAAGEIDKLEPWWFYVWNHPAHLLPWTILVPAAVVAALRNGRPEERRIDRFLVAWMFTSWVVFSFSLAKRGLYLIPLHPAAALLIARLVRDAADAPERLRDPLVHWPRRIFAIACIALGCAVVLACLLMLTGVDHAILDAAVSAIGGKLVRWRDNWELSRVDLTTGPLLLAGALAAGIAYAGLVTSRATTALRAFAWLIAGAACFLLLQATVLFPSRDADESPRAFLTQVRAKIGAAPLARVGGDGGLQYAVNWVTERDRVREIWATAGKGGRVDGDETAHRAAAFLAAPEPRYFVTDADEMKHVADVPGAVEILRVKRRRNPDLILYGNAAAPRR